MKSNNIYISYAWGGDSEEMVNKLDKSFQDKGITIIRDKRDLGFKGNIKEFMQEIGEGEAIITVISDKYLKSENCMFEMLEIYNNKNIWERIFPIVLSDAKIYDEIDRIDYINYWNDRIAELNTKIKTISNPAGIGKVIEKVNQYNDIHRRFDEITDMLRNMNTLTPDMHKEADFDTIHTAIQDLFSNKTEENTEAITVEANKENKRKRFDTTMQNITDNRLKRMLKRLEGFYDMIDEYEDLLKTATNPIEKKRYNEELDTLNEQVDKLENQIKSMQ